MRRRYLARIRTWVTIANAAMAIGIGVFITLVVAPQLFTGAPEAPVEVAPLPAVQRLDFAGGLASGAPVGDAIFVRTPTGATVYTSDGDVVARFEGQIASFTWLRDGTGVLLREGVGGADAVLPVEVFELDGTVTRLPLEAPEATAASAAVSPDGRWIAFAKDRLLIADRDGGELRRLSDPTAPLTLLGWDRSGRVLARDPESLSAYSVDGRREQIGLPAGLRAVALERVPGGDPGAVVLRAGGSLWSASGDFVTGLPGDCVPFWPRPAELLCLASGFASALDVTTGTRRHLAGFLDDAAHAGLRACGDEMLVWVDRASVVRALDLVTGVSRVLDGAPPSARIEALPDARFLANDGRATYLIDPRAR